MLLVRVPCSHAHLKQTFDNDSRSRASSRSSQAHFAEDWRAEYDAML